MRIHVLQHVPFEGPANVAEWARDRGHGVTTTRFFADGGLPVLDDVDWLVVLGGPMGVHDVDEYPWLAREKSYLREAIEADRTVLGVCLGAQLVADVLGSDVYRHDHREIGWFPVMADGAAESSLVSNLPREFTAFHWHGDTFDLPQGAKLLYRSDACRNQAFVYEENVVGLQFHLESTAESVRDLVAASDVDDGPYVQDPEDVLARTDRCRDLRRYLYDLLDSLARR